MTAPKNMPTKVLVQMVCTAQGQRDEWARDVIRLKERLAGAEWMVENYTKEHDRLLADLKEREQEEQA